MSRSKSAPRVLKLWREGVSIRRLDGSSELCSVDERQRWACLAGGPPQRSRTIFGVPDAKEDDPPVPQLQPSRDDFGVERIATADDGHDLPQVASSLWDERKAVGRITVLKSGMEPAAFVTRRPESGISPKHLPSVLMDGTLKIYLELSLWMHVP